MNEEFLKVLQRGSPALRTLQAPTHPVCSGGQTRRGRRRKGAWVRREALQPTDQSTRPAKGIRAPSLQRRTRNPLCARTDTNNVREKVSDVRDGIIAPLLTMCCVKCALARRPSFQGDSLNIVVRRHSGREPAGPEGTFQTRLPLQPTGPELPKRKTPRIILFLYRHGRLEEQVQVRIGCPQGLFGDPSVTSSLSR